MRVWRDTNATHIVLGCDDLSSAACAVRIVYETRQRQVLVQVKVVRGARLKSIDQVRVCIVDTVVNQGDSSPLPLASFQAPLICRSWPGMLLFNRCHCL